MTNKSDHNFFMKQALKQAAIAFKKGEVPIGAILVDEHGAIIARGHNQTEARCCQTMHAEVIAIKKACKKRKNWRLDNCWLYTTLEPCVMCFGLILLTRIAGVVYGAPSPLFGALDKLYLSHEKSKNNNASIKIDEKFDMRQIGRIPTIIGGLNEDESVAILKTFFKQARQKRGEKCEV